MINIQIALEQEQIANYVDETPVNILDSSRFTNGIQTALKTIQKGKLHIIWLRNIQAFQFFFFLSRFCLYCIKQNTVNYQEMFECSAAENETMD